MANKKFSEFVLKTDTSGVSHIVGYNGAENVQITPANFVTTGGTGIFLPLAGGTMTGALVVDSTATVNDILTAGLGLAVTGGAVGSSKLVLASTNKVHLSGGSAGLVLQNTGGTKSLTIDDTLSTFVGLVSGITPVDAANFVTKAYVDGGGGAGSGFLPLSAGSSFPLTGTLTINNSSPLIVNGDDPLISFQNSATNHWQVGLENSQSDRFVFYDNNANAYQLILESTTGNATFASDVTVKGTFLNIFGGNSALAGSIQAYTSQGGLYFQASGPNQNIGLIPSGTGKVRVTGASADTTLSIETETGTTIFPILDFISSHSTVGGQIRQGGTSVIAFDKALNSTFAGDVLIQKAASTGLIIRTTTNTEPFIAIQRNSGANGVAVLNVEDGGILAFDTGATGAAQSEKMRLDASGQLGIGSSSPDVALDVEGASNLSSRIRLTKTTNSRTLEIGADRDGTSAPYIGSFTNHNFDFITNDTVKMSIGTSGFVTIKNTPNTTDASLTLQNQGDVDINETIGYLNFSSTDTSTSSSGGVGGIGVYAETAFNTSFTPSYMSFYTHATTNNNGTILGNVTEKMRLNSTGVLGIGHTPNSSYSKLQVKSPPSSYAFDLIGRDAGSNGESQISFWNSNQTTQLAAFGNLANNLLFITDTTEKMRLNSAGSLLVGTSSTLASRLVLAAPSGTSNIMCIKTGSTSNSNVGAIIFQNSGGSQVGQITVNGATGVTAYITSSDYRLKEDLQDFKGLDLVSKIPVYNYKWKADESRSYGVMAHQLQEVLPDAVSGDKDAEEMQGVDYSKIVPVLVKAIQELKAEIELLKK